MPTRIEKGSFDGFPYTIEAQWDETHWVKFTVWEIEGETEHEVALYHDSGLHLVPNFRDAEVFLKGSITFDGCSDWEFHPDHDTIHFCGNPAKSLAALFDKLYVIQGEIYAGTESLSKN